VLIGYFLHVAKYPLPTVRCLQINSAEDTKIKY
jgi:hypothetical protein